MAAFQCWLKLPLVSSNGPIEGPILIEQVAIRPRKMLSKGDLLFVVSAPLGLYEARSNMEGSLEALKAEEGKMLPEFEQFGCIVTDGENIPYGQPYIIATAIERP